MNTIQSRRLLTASSLAALLALGACGERIADTTTVDRTAEPVAIIPAPAPVAPAAGTEMRPEAASNNSTVMGAPSAAVNAASNAATSVSNAASNLGDRVDDGQITARINAGLAADSNLSAIRIDVDTEDGVVTLKGPVPNAAAKKRAEEIAKGVNEVKSVRNELTVSAS